MLGLLLGHTTSQTESGGIKQAPIPCAALPGDIGDVGASGCQSAPCRAFVIARHFAPQRFSFMMRGLNWVLIALRSQVIDRISVGSRGTTVSGTVRLDG
jgi:hypothetical protein